MFIEVDVDEKQSIICEEQEDVNLVYFFDQLLFGFFIFVMFYFEVWRVIEEEKENKGEVVEGKEILISILLVDVLVCDESIVYNW